MLRVSSSLIGFVMHSFLTEVQVCISTQDFLSGDRSDELCRDFQRGHCPRGEGCWFQHVQRESGWDVELSAPGQYETVIERLLIKPFYFSTYPYEMSRSQV